MTALLEGLEPGDGDGGQDFGEGQFSCGYREADGQQDDRPDGEQIERAAKALHNPALG